MPREAGKRVVRYDGDAAVRAAMLKGISHPAAIALYDESMNVLKERGEASYMTALQLRDACAWTEVIEQLGRRLRLTTLSDEASEGQLRTLMRNKAAAESARTKIMDSLLLIPQRPRGRPKGEGTSGAEAREEASMDAWDAFDSLAGEEET